ncbi:non-hydrolyzing UDP-N-acetylglucosamine 2-epimerase [Magnetospirillum sulfuroxidans]|uniref:UDP-N-acetylglucosamine 2-epimerase (Non-hydrolyzing) n=1 Tax=Magnetospirillum sulfuroxidans TaxID=611300 RepID=A0ABS5IEE2_9PROT|nr:UDP-N-acetylglucosamine 2-epimerase (non-hydrolyzing) [Magnetospirillum sulfuroxidans]MBR9972785.1 UDP-N-acetylglucosamine 2-epimerase (non-hydrolyzing) [Magnetospirillum sulfuroxidans]
MPKSLRNVLCIVGARPNYMKVAPIHAALAASGSFRPVLIHTGQHYDTEMNDAFFRELGLPAPDLNLEVGSGSHAVQTAEVMRRFEPIVDQTANPVVLVVGDVNSTLACALVAVKKSIPVLHVEAGLRSGDRTMPEEINRILTDQMSDMLFTTERSALDNLIREGIAAARVHFVGNVMIDSLRANLPRAVPPTQTLAVHGFAQPPAFAVATLHRPANVDDPDILRRLLESLHAIGQSLPVILPLHPRTKGRVQAAGLDHFLDGCAILPLRPASYLTMLGLMAQARLVLTDSGGIQEETTALGVPCLTLRDNTERPVTISEGTNTLVGRDPDAILTAARNILETGGKRGRIPEFWDGRASDRIVATMIQAL